MLIVHTFGYSLHELLSHCFAYEQYFKMFFCRLKLFVGDKVTQYNGPRDLSSLAEFVEQQTQTKEVHNKESCLISPLPVIFLRKINSVRWNWMMIRFNRSSQKIVFISLWCTPHGKWVGWDCLAWLLVVYFLDKGVGIASSSLQCGRS